MKLPDDTDNPTRTDCRFEQFGGTFLGELTERLVQMLRLHRIACATGLQQLGREAWNAPKGEPFTLGQRITDAKLAVVGNANDIARPCVLGRLALRGQKEDRVGDRHRFADPHVMQLHPPFEMPRAEPHKRHAVAVLGVHVRLYFEDEAGDLGLLRRDLAFTCHPWLGRWRVVCKALQQLLNPERVDCRAKPDRCHMPFEKALPIKSRHQFARHFDFFTKLLKQMFGHVFSQPGIVQPLQRDRARLNVTIRPVHQLQAVVDQIIRANEFPPDTNRPTGRCDVQREAFLDLVNDLEDVAAFAIHLVAECQDRQIAQTADLEQLLGLALNAFGTIDHHDRGIHGSECPVGILREVLVARRVDQIEPKIFVFERHGRGGDRDAAILFHLHEIRTRAPCLTFRPNLPGHLNGATIEQQLFRQRSLTGVRVRDDRKGPTPGNFRRKNRCIGSMVEHARAIAERPGLWKPYRRSHQWDQLEICRMQLFRRRAVCRAHPQVMPHRAQ